ncbi:M20/M25/M40 family metallo-hydrolase, partial [Nocardioides sp. CER28]
MTDPVERLAALIRIPTVSHRDPGLIDTAAFDRLLETMSTQWPLLHALEVTRIGSHGLLVHWAGRSAERPVVLMAHLDVVPVVPDDWSRDPFGGEVVDGEIWGRGTLDDKGCVAAICEAVESLLADGFVPAQDVWLSFGCDEEVSGGAAQAAVEVLRERGVAPWFVLDEGGAIAHEAFPGVVAPVGVVGVTEKGTTSVTLTVTGDGGHASTPVRNGPTVRLAKALAKLDAAAMPAR